MAITADQRALLLREIFTDPEKIGYRQFWVDERSDSGVATLMNEKRYPGRKLLPVHDQHDGSMSLENWALLTTDWDAINEAAANHSSAQVRMAARLAVDLVEKSHLQTVDLDSQMFRQMVGVLVQGSVLPQEHVDQLLAYGDTLISRAEVLIGSGIVLDHIDIAQVWGRGF